MSHLYLPQLYKCFYVDLVYRGKVFMSNNQGQGSLFVSKALKSTFWMSPAYFFIPLFFILFYCSVKKSWLFRMNWSLDGVGVVSMFSCFDPIPCGLCTCRSKVYSCPISPGTLFCRHCCAFHGEWVLFGACSNHSSTIWSGMIYVRKCFVQPEGSIIEELSEW